MVVPPNDQNSVSFHHLVSVSLPCSSLPLVLCLWRVFSAFSAGVPALVQPSRVCVVKFQIKRQFHYVSLIKDCVGGCYGYKFWKFAIYLFKPFQDYNLSVFRLPILTDCMFDVCLPDGSADLVTRANIYDKFGNPQTLAYLRLTSPPRSK